MKGELIHGVPEDKDIARCRLPDSLFKDRFLSVNQWVLILSSERVIYSRAWPFLKNGPKEGIVQANPIISREAESISEVDTMSGLSSGECLYSHVNP